MGLQVYGISWVVIFGILFVMKVNAFPTIYLEKAPSFHGSSSYIGLLPS